MKRRFVNTLTALGISAMLMMPFTACNSGKNLEAGATWQVIETMTLTNLTIGKDASIKAPEGYSVTMTIDGIETPIKEGSYKGKITLTITKENPVTATVFGDTSTYIMRAAVDVEDGKYIKEKSVEAAAVGGTVTDTSAKDVSITSVSDNFNGIIVKGDSTYTIDNPKIKLTGHGGNDFAGYGAGIMTEGTTKVTVNKASIVNKGAIRTAIVVRGNSVVTVNDSDIEVFNGPLPEDYAFKWQKPSGALMQVPWFLGLLGTNRATMLIENGTAYYNNTRIKAQGWGALSTDSVQNVNLYTSNCHVEVTDSGYGSYSDGSSNTFSKTKFDVKDYALIMTGGKGVFTDECVVNSGRIGVMFHGAGNLNIDKGSVFNTKEAVIQVKGGFPTIVVDNAQLNSENGLILQAMVNDDPNKQGGSSGGASGAAPGGSSGGASAGGQGGMPGGQGGAMPSGGQGGAPAAGGMPSGQGGQGGAAMPSGGQGDAPAGDKGGTPAVGGMPGGQGGTSGGAQGAAPGGGMPGGPGGGSSAITATFKNMTLKGDIVNAMTGQGDIIVNFEKAAITGAISTATGVHDVGPNGEKLVMKEETDLYYLIGKEKETLCETNDKYGVKVSLDSNSSWIIDKTSYLTGLTIADGASITAPAGYKVSMTVNGVEKPVKAGEYKGKIKIVVTKS